VAIYYLFQHRPKWHKAAAVGKTVVSSQMIDRVTAKLGRKLYEYRSALNGFVMACSTARWGLAAKRVPARLSSVWMAAFGRRTRMGSSRPYSRQRSLPAWGATLARSTANSRRELGEPVYELIEAPATPEQKAILANLSPQQVRTKELPAKKSRPSSSMHRATAHPSEAEGGGRKWVVRGTPIRDRGYLQDLYREFFADPIT